MLAGCGSDPEPAADDTAARSADSAFPAKVEHKFGTTTVPAKPERIVVAGLTEQGSPASGRTSSSASTRG